MYAYLTAGTLFIVNANLSPLGCWEEPSLSPGVLKLCPIYDLSCTYQCFGSWHGMFGSGSINNNQVQPANNQDASSTNTTRSNKNYIGQVVIPYTQGTAKGFKNICGKCGIQVHFKGNTTIKQLLMKPKEQDPKEKKSGIIYSYQCTNIACDEEYIGETSRTLGEGCKEHLKQPSPIYAHIQQTSHTIEASIFNIIGKEDQGQARTIKESIYIRVNNPNLNQNIGKYNLSHIWDRVLFNTPGLKLGSSQQPSS